MAGYNGKKSGGSPPSDKIDYATINENLIRRGPLPQRFKTKYGGGARPSEELGRSFETIYPQTKQATSDGERSRTGKTLGQMVAVVSAALIGGSAFFLSSNLTGNAIWNLSSGETNLIGVIMFVVGLVGLFAFVKGK